MTVAAVGDKVLRLVECIFKIRCTVHCKDGRKFLMRELLGKLNALDLTDKDFGAFWHLDPRELRYLIRRLTDYLRVQSAVYNYGLSDLFKFIIL